MKKLIIPAILLFAIACSKKSTTTTTEVDLSKVSARFPGYTVDQFREGKSLYESNCGNCHGLKKPKAYSEEKWAGIVPPMVGKVNKKAGSEVLDKAKEELILRYLITAKVSG